MPDATDEILCKKIIAQDEEAFRVLYEKYRDHIYGYTLKLCGLPEVASDAVQEVFMKIWVKRETLNPGLSVKAYLYTTTRNYVFDYLRKAVHDQKFREYFLQMYTEDTGAMDDILYTRQLETIKMNAIAQLPAQRQLIFRMSKVQGCSNQEIADQLGISVNTVRDQLVKASRFVRHYLYQHADISIIIAAFCHILR
ncbi:RNA polymerase sigma-70 factor, ECF subfamily [Chitinophaga ginsengisegetis]|uniref:RNA polymerase sigma-70 factor, ECF subfamily n=1 Tax=Chitinophaga ginsengisegetis TaxID=393003 RepID=A0A1T5NN40_9BACT|nr:RNA polymerase sigma-70 factor [Chitinophaga ginsengisegetis]MDR6565424.1 RNA polymerase sigma-70 factor (ECF subfamily) [Chitinophaga ginsengisegetis]MDR6645152.1 RNA polymerase sigma-70 factor (ECF subfamily) [Chitinophaga ginsengisegetis]MDR6652256.1 RNA polymerase sigma-70 factor (ECF subfamily) [Chitinophaga ginsengisegetis]SKD01767.1 RNA polymerase sigma-70 factor, ECF subfamily [Chitinophaga ginsengisegetis]